MAKTGGMQFDIHQVAKPSMQVHTHVAVQCRLLQSEHWWFFWQHRNYNYVHVHV